MFQRIAYKHCPGNTSVPATNVGPTPANYCVSARTRLRYTEPESRLKERS